MILQPMHFIRMQWFGLLLGLLLGPTALAGSPFYLTAERSFASNEAPILRLDYTVTDQPLTVRILQPDNPDAFLDGQLNLSRSYEQPLSELNPGHYFAKGLNAAQSPLRLLRGMLNVEFRKSLQGTALNKAIVNVAQQPLAAVPQQILVAPPRGMRLVKESYLDLQRNGTATHDLGWWFGQDAWNEQRYKVRTLTLDPLPDGIYLVQAVQGKTEAQCLIQVSSLAVQVKQSAGQLLVRAMTRDLTPVAGARISYRDSRGRWQTLPGRTDGGGELALTESAGLDGRLVVRVDDDAGQRTALTVTDFMPVQSVDDEVFVLTDRPIFKPGETFFYKGLVRKRQQGQLSVPTFVSRQADVTLIKSDGQATGLQQRVELTDFGSFSGSFTLDEAQTPGLYRLLAQIDQKPYGGEFRVRDYVKPTFYLQWLEHSPVATPGQPFKLAFRAKRYSGGVPQNVRYEVFLYRKKFEAPQFVVEAGAGLSTGNDYFGNVKSAAPLTQPQRLYSSIEARQAAENANPWESAAQLTDSGDGRFEFTVPAGDPKQTEQEWIYTLMVRAQDQSGGQAILNDDLYVTLAPAQPALRFDKTVAAVGDDNVRLLLQSSFADGKPAAQGAGTIDVWLERPGADKSDRVKLPFNTDQQGRQVLVLPALRAPGRLVATATLDTLNGQALAHPARSPAAMLVVAGTGGEAVADNREVELYAPSSVLSPGDTVKVFALLPQDWGQGESGSVWQTVAGANIFEHRALPSRGRSLWLEATAKPEYGTGFYVTLTVPTVGGKFKEQTLGFRIVPADKRLTLDVRPQHAEAEPLKPARIELTVKRADGTPAADTELAVSVVDRAVYAVQAEFRPSLFDFFYPPQRLNLATFYADELQGYGYADLLRKPNFALSALKSQSKLAKKAMRDTAGWFPHVVTDSNGRAVIDVDMPANLTEWLVTAVAADRQGRIGETTGQFRTVSDVAVDLAAPQFMRSGDRAELTVQLANHLQESVALTGRVIVAEPLAAVDGQRELSASVAARGESNWPLDVTAGKPGTATLGVQLAAPPGVRVGGLEQFSLPIQPASLQRRYTATRDGDRLRTALPAEASVQQLIVQVDSGLLGAALQAATMLVSYPYGCTEQLAHSTVPNLVLMDLLERVGIQPEQLGAWAQPLNRARRNAAVGIRKLIQNQKADGGFALWPGDAQASVPVSLIAVEALRYAVDLKIEGAAKAYNKGVEWLTAQSGNLTTEDGFVLAGLANAVDSYSTPWQQQLAFVERVAANQQAAVPDLIDALRIVAVYRSQSWHGFNQALKTQPALSGDLVKRLQLALTAFDPTQAEQETPEAFRQMGFGYGAPSILAAGMGVLQQLDGLPAPLASKLKKQLLQQRRQGYWLSTYDTAQVILHSRNLLSQEAQAAQRDAAAGGRQLTVVDRNGAKLGSLTRIPGGFRGEFGDLGLAERGAELTVRGLNADDDAQATLSVELPYAVVSPASQGLQVERSYRRVTANGSEPFDVSQPLRVGDTVVSIVRVKRQADRSAAGRPSRFVVVEDGIPSLAEGLEADRTYLADAGIRMQPDSYWQAIKETQRYPDRILRVAELQASGELLHYQVWRATRAGNAAVPPAKVFDMYNENLQGNSVAERVTVVK